MFSQYSHDSLCEIIKVSVPERKSNIDALIQKHTISFIPDTISLKFRSYVKPNGNIIIHTKPLTRLWASTYAHFRLYDYVQKNNGIGKYLSFSKDKDANEAAELLAWAVKLDNNCDHPSKYDALYSQYPGDVSPFGFKNEDVLGMGVQDISIFSIGYILLHEIAHLELIHTPVNDVSISISQEYEADRWAANFVMDHIKQYCSQRMEPFEDVFLKRLLSLLVCSYWLITRECSEGVSTNHSHPPIFERLNKIICEFVNDPNHLAWALTSVILSLHLQRIHREASPLQQFMTFREYSDYCMNYISKINA